MRWFFAFVICVNSCFVRDGLSHSQSYYTAFQDEFLRQQKQYLAAGGLTSPAPSGYIPFTITNNSGFADTNIYIFIETNGGQNIIAFSDATGQMLGSQVLPPSKTYTSAQSSGSYTLNSFLNNGSYVFYLPTTINMVTSRIYFSVGNPLDWIILTGNSLQVPPLDFIDLSKDGYYTLFDKLEFTLNASSSLVMNPTMVDYYGLPLSFYITTGSSPNLQYSYAGLPPSVPSATVFSTYDAAAALLPVIPNSGTRPVWAGLSLTYQAPSGSSAKPLRILSGGSALDSGNSLVPVSTRAYQYFSAFNNYFLSANNYVSTVSTPCNWFNTVWNSSFYPVGSPLYIDLSVAGPGSGVASGYIDGSGNFIFSVTTDATNACYGSAKGFTMTLPTPTSSLPFFTGSLNDYAPALSASITGNAYATVLWEIFSSAVMAGIVPLTGTSCSSPLSENYIRSHALFQSNTNLACTASSTTSPPWYDFYSKTLLGLGTGNYTKYYTFPYADVWATDGTITIANISTVNAQVFINIGDMTGIVVPDPFDDTTTYTVTFGALPLNADLSPNITVTFGTNSDYTSNPSVATGGQTFNTVIGGTMYMGVTYTTGSYAGLWGTHIIPSVAIPALKPVLPGTWTISQSGGTVNISLGASP